MLPLLTLMLLASPPDVPDTAKRLPQRQDLDHGGKPRAPDTAGNVKRMLGASLHAKRRLVVRVGDIVDGWEIIAFPRPLVKTGPHRQQMSWTPQDCGAERSVRVLRQKQVADGALRAVCTPGQVPMAKSEGRKAAGLATSGLAATLGIAAASAQKDARGRPMRVDTFFPKNIASPVQRGYVIHLWIAPDPPQR